MAYLTKSVYSHLVNKLTIRKVEVDIAFFCKYIYDNPFVSEFFNKLELQKLYIFRYLLENINYEVNFLYAEEIPDTKLYVFTRGGKVKYHLYADCKAVNGDFFDFHIPVEVRENSLVEEYRNWFVKNVFKERFQEGLITQSQIIFHYNTTFAKKYGLPILNQGYTLIEHKINSGRDIVKKKDIKALMIKLDELIVERYYLTGYCPILELLSKFDFLYNKDKVTVEEKLAGIVGLDFINKYGYIKLINFLKSHRELKKQVHSLLKDFFQEKYDLDNKQFQTPFLEAHGLVCCSLCKNKALMSQV